MSLITCSKCGYTWAGDQSPICSMCNIKHWENYAGFIKPKHDPSILPNPMDRDRSVVTMDCITDKELYISELAQKGQYYYDTIYNNITCVLNQPLGNTAGSVVPAWNDWPTRALDAQKVVDVFGDAHVYAVKYSTVNYEIASGRLVQARFCSVKGCINLAVPPADKCIRH